MNSALLPMATLAASFLTLFGSAQWLYRRFEMEGEWSRKLVHVLSGFITLSFPLVLDSHWQVLLLSIAFGIILLLSKRLGLLGAINDIDRASQGSILYPLAVYLSFVIYELKGGGYLWFYAPMLTMVLCDPVAAWVGKRHPWKPYRVKSEVKTCSGSLAFFGTAFLLLTVLFAVLGESSSLPVLLIALPLAALATLVEGLSQHGRDNLWIPLAVAVGMELLGV